MKYFRPMSGTDVAARAVSTAAFPGTAGPIPWTSNSVMAFRSLLSKRTKSSFFRSRIGFPAASRTRTGTSLTTAAASCRGTFCWAGDCCGRESSSAAPTNIKAARRIALTFHLPIKLAGSALAPAGRLSRYGLSDRQCRLGIGDGLRRGFLPVDVQQVFPRGDSLKPAFNELGFAAGLSRRGDHG